MTEIDERLRTQAELDALDAKLRIILPPQYQDSYEEIEPVSMGAAGLKFDATGHVAWDEIWGSFCNLAMAGGPPHKGKLLEPAGRAEIEAQPGRYQAVVDEICRGIRMVSYQVAVERSPDPGWVRVMCPARVMAEWLVRAIVMENVSAHLDGNTVELPAGPHYRIEKEIKNVITVIAKTSHYFEGHMEAGQQQRIASLFAESGQCLLQPCRTGEASADEIRAARSRAAANLLRASGMAVEEARYAAWIGLECETVASAIWMMRALVAGNTLARREDRLLYVPVHPSLDPDGERIASAVAEVRRLEIARRRTASD